MMALAQPLYYCDLLLFKSVFLYCLSWHQCSQKVFLHITVNLIRCGSASKFVLAGSRQLATRIKRQPNLPLQPAKAHRLIGHIREFHSDSEVWISYTERLELYFAANGIEDATKRQAILLSVCGPSTYQLIRDLLSPTKPMDKSFAELVTLVKEHQQPAPSFIVQRYNFNTRVQQPGEMISAFVAQLRKIARDCQ